MNQEISVFRFDDDCKNGKEMNNGLYIVGPEPIKIGKHIVPAGNTIGIDVDYSNPYGGGKRKFQKLCPYTGAKQFHINEQAQEIQIEKIERLEEEKKKEDKEIQKKSRIEEKARTARLHGIRISCFLAHGFTRLSISGIINRI